MHRHRAPWQGRARARLRLRQPRDRRELTPRHRFRVASHSKSFTAAGVAEAARARQAQARRSGRTICRRPASRGRARDRSRSSSRTPRASSATARTPASSSTAGRPSTPRAAGGSEAPLIDRAELALQILQPRLRTARPDHRGDHRRALPQLDQARGRRRGRPRPRPRPTCRCRAARRSRAATPARCRLGRRVVIPATSRPTRSPGRRLRQHGRRSRALSSRSSRPTREERPLGREPARDDAPPVAQSAFAIGAATTASARSAARSTAGTGPATGGLQGYISRTRDHPEQELTICGAHQRGRRLGASVGRRHGHISCRRSPGNGAPSRKVKDWTGRWWSLWGATDLVPMGDKVLMAGPGFFNPLIDASEIAITGRNTGRIALANGYRQPRRAGALRAREVRQDHRGCGFRHHASARRQGRTRDGSALRRARRERAGGKGAAMNQKDQSRREALGFSRPLVAAHGRPALRSRRRWW